MPKHRALGLRWDQLLSRLLLSVSITIVGYIFILWKTISFDIELWWNFLGHLVGLIVGIFWCMYAIRRIKNRIYNEVFYHFIRPPIVILLLLIILSFMLSFYVVFFGLPDHFLFLVGPPIMVSCVVASAGVVIWLIRYEKDHGVVLLG